jgi:hypothetical protein
MADINLLQRLINGVSRNVDLQANALVVGSLKVGAMSPTELTKTILDRLISLQNGSDVDATYHTHDGRYYTETELNSATGTSGADLIGVKATPANYVPAQANVEAHLAAIDSALLTAGATEFADTDFRILDDGDSTKKIAFQASAITTATTRTITMANADVDLADIADNSAAIADLQTLSGVAANAEDLGSFTGSIIPDNSDIKEALQALETEIESIPDPIFYAGVWNASTNSPDLDDVSARVQGALYRVSVAGTHDFGGFGGSITFKIGDKAVYNGSTWEKWDVNDADIISDDVTEGSTNLYFTDERAQDAVGNILTDSASIDFDYDDAGNTISAEVLPAGVDHDQLLNFVSNEHVDHSTVQIATAAATSGLSGGGDLTATRNLVVDITGTTAETVSAANDELLIWDVSASARRKMTIENALKGQNKYRSMIAGESFAADTTFAVRFAIDGETAGRVYKADFDASADNEFYVIGLVQASSAVDAGDPVDVLIEGVMILGSGDTAFAADEIGEPVHLKAAGAWDAVSTITYAADQASFRLGMVENTDRIYVDSKQLLGIY